MLRRASTMIAAVTLGLVTAFVAPVHAQTTEKPLVLKGQSTHPASSNFHLIFKLWAETVEKMTAGRLKIETLPAGAIVPPFEVFDATS
jgi:TRAP-type mannitol/chloroaromatic compound transport system substrate-binding protein